MCAFQEYETLNELVNNAFFDRGHNLLPIFLSVEGNVASRLATKLDIEQESLHKIIARAVRSTLDLGRAGKVYSYHNKSLEVWLAQTQSTNSKIVMPPFTTLLCALTMAASRMSADNDIGQNNYYIRLFELLSVDDESDKTRIKKYAQDTLRFWEALNQWLSGLDFEYGRPTAAKVRNWAYVSYPLSQALVRDADRKVLSRMYAHMDRSPDEEITAGEMMLYIHEWMHTTEPTSWIRMLWDNLETRDRLIASAQAGFETWQGSESDSQEGRRRLGWFATFHGKFGTKGRLRLMLGVSNTCSSDIRLRVSPGSLMSVEKAFVKAKEELKLEPYVGLSISCIEPIDKIQIGQLLYDKVELQTLDCSQQFQSIPKLVIPFAKSEEASYYREVSRITMFKEHIVLCHGNLVDKLIAYLRSASRNNFKEFKAQTMAGIPEGWYLLTNVHIVLNIDPKDNNFIALVPLATRATIEYTGGLRLDRDLWHSQSSPIVSVSGEQDEFKVCVSKATLNDCNPILAEGNTQTGLVEIDMGAMVEKLPFLDANLQISVQCGKAEIGNRKIAFRSADHPRPLRDKYVYAIDKDNPVTAIQSLGFDDEIDEVLLLQGFYVSGYSWVDEEPALSGVNDSLDMDEFSFGADHSYNLKNNLLLPAVVRNESCIIRGHHIWQIPPADSRRGRNAPLLGVCNDCGLSYWFPALVRGGRTRGRLLRNASRDDILNNDVVSRKPCLDTILDGLFYIGSGNVKKISRLVASYSTDQSFAYRFIADQMCLGNIDVKVGVEMKPAAWSAAPPVLCKSASGSLYLSGFRSVKMLVRLKAELSKYGWVYKPIQQSANVLLHNWEEGGDTLEFVDAVTTILDPHGRSMRFAENPSFSIARELPPIGSLASYLPSIHIGEGEQLQRYDIYRCKWEDCDSIAISGAYRKDYAGRRYILRTLDGLLKEGTPEIVKILAAQQAGVSLHGYQASSQSFYSVLGCEPPGLYARALVGCSGCLPTRDGMRVTYGTVPEDVAGLILSKLHSETKS